MTALANTLERLALAPVEDRVLSETILDDYQFLLELANDVYVASLETHVASLECLALD
ncbi:MAG: hypothetical protein K2X93_03700 [Candidatus Obscuribacterales bacterium]|nr:hypothetical protein [Candidatus Obscuribacterales bacterium]